MRPALGQITRPPTTFSLHLREQCDTVGCAENGRESADRHSGSGAETKLQSFFRASLDRDCRRRRNADFVSCRDTDGLEPVYQIIRAAAVRKNERYGGEEGASGGL